MFGFVIIFLVFILIFGFWDSAKPKNFPPGPRCWPFLGSLLQVRRLLQLIGSQHGVLQKLSLRYGPVLGFRLGRAPPTIFLSGSNDVLQALRVPELSGRPQCFASQYRTMGKIRGLLYADNEEWYKQRNLVSKSLETLRKGGEFANLVRIESQKLKNVLKESVSARREVLRRTVTNILWFVVTGEVVLERDLGLLDVLEKLSEREEKLTETLHHSSWTQHISEHWSGYNQFAGQYSQLWIFLSEKVYEHRRTERRDTPRDLMDLFLEDMKSNQMVTELDVVACCMDLLAAGLAPTSALLEAVLDQLATHPDVLTKVREEITKDSEFRVEDIPRCHYLQAVVSEVQRLSNVCPTTRCHRARTEFKMKQYLIPEDSLLIMDLSSVHLDPRLWKNPSEFRPERFLDSKGTFMLSNFHLPYGSGRRKCLGENLAQHIIFAITSNIVRS